MTTEELFQSKLKSDEWLDMIPRMRDLRRYAEQCSSVVEFGVRSGNSTIAFLAGGCAVHSFDRIDPVFECPEDSRNRWTFEKSEIKDLNDIPSCDILMLDSRHREDQVANELRHAHRAQKFLLFHDVIEWGWRGEDGQPGINFAICDFMRANHQWKFRECLYDQWGLLVLERR